MSKSSASEVQSVADLSDEAKQAPAAEADPRIARSRMGLINATTDLLRERSAEAITASDVARQAGVSRPTLYQHFGDLHNLVVATAVSNLEHLFTVVWPRQATVPSLGADPTNDIQLLLEFIHADQDFYLNVTRGPSSYRVLEALTTALNQRLTTRTPPAVHTHVTPEHLRFISHGVIGMAIDWLTTAQQQSAHQLALTLHSLARNTLAS